MVISMDQKQSKQARKEEQELEKAYESVTHGKKGKPKFAAPSQKSRIAVITAISITVVILIGLIIFTVISFHKKESSPLFTGEHLTVAGVDISGMTAQEARQAIADATDTSYSRQSMMIQVGAYTLELSPGVSGADLDLERLMTFLEAHPDRSGEFDLLPYLTVDEDAVRDSLNTQWEPFASEKTPPSWELKGDAPDLHMTEEEITCQKLVITMGTSLRRLDMDGLYQEILKTYNKNRFRVEYSYTTEQPEMPDLEEIHQELTTEPVSAEMDMETFEVTPHTFGYTFDLEAAQKLLEDIGGRPTVEIPMVLTAPETLTEDLAGLLFRDELGSFTATSVSQPGRDNNLKMACEAIDGIVLNPGDVFTYDKTLGQRTPEKGWQLSAGYVGMDTVPSYGGGICQPSSCLYYSALLADIEIVERHSHTFISSYMPYGMDATVSWQGPDLKIKNTTDYPIRIEASAKGPSVTVRLVGTDTKDYYIKMDYTVDWTEPWKTVYKEFPKNDAEGHKNGEVLVTPYTGYKITTYKNKYDKETDELISRDKEVTSIYSRRDKVICKLVDPPAEPPTVTPTEESSESEKQPDIEFPDFGGRFPSIEED